MVARIVSVSLLLAILLAAYWLLVVVPALGDIAQALAKVRP